MKRFSAIPTYRAAPGLLAMIASTAACGGAPTEGGAGAPALGTTASEVKAPATIHIAWLGADPGEVYDNANLLGARTRAQLDAVQKHCSTQDADVTPFYAEFDPTVQLQQCEDMVNSGDFSAAIVMAADQNALIPCVEHARKKHIPIVAADLPLGPDNSTVEPQVKGVVGAVLTPPGKFGPALADLVVTACGATPCNIVYFAGSFGIAIDIEALADLANVTASHPNIQIISQQQAFYDTATAHDLMQGVLAQTHDIQLLVSSADQMAQGAAQALSEAGVTGVKIIGAGAGTQAVNEVKAGSWYATFVALPYDEGNIAADWSIRAVRHEHIQVDGIDPVVLHGWPAFFTQGNQDQFVGFVPQW